MYAQSKAEQMRKPLDTEDSVTHLFILMHTSVCMVFVVTEINIKKQLVSHYRVGLEQYFAKSWSTVSSILVILSILLNVH